MINILIAVGIFTALSALLGCLIGFCAKKFQVKEDPRIEEILKMLPGANCGGCGHPGCSGMAIAIVNEGASVIACKPCKADQADLITSYLKTHTGPEGEYIE